MMDVTLVDFKVGVKFGIINGSRLNLVLLLMDKLSWLMSLITILGEFGHMETQIK